MKKLFYPFAVLCLSIPALSFAQTPGKNETSTRSITKKIEVNEENGVKTVKVETSENGNTTTEVYTGTAADEYLNNQQGIHRNTHPHMMFKAFPEMDSTHQFNIKIDDGNFNFHFNLDSMMKTLNFDWTMEMGNLQESMKKLEEEMKNMKIDIQSFGFDDSAFNFSNGNQVIILDDADLDEKTKEELKKMGIDIDLEKKEGNKVVSKVIVARVVMIEDMEQDKKVKELEDVNIGFFPNPGNGDFTLEFTIEEEKDDAVITIHDLTGKQIYTETVKGKGTYKKQISLNEPSGVYIIKIQQGKRAITKKLIIE